jgi:hypothetical protein
VLVHLVATFSADMQCLQLNWWVASMLPLVFAADLLF